MKHSQKKPTNQAKVQKSLNKDHTPWSKADRFLLTCTPEALYNKLRSRRGCGRYVAAVILKYQYQYPDKAFPSRKQIKDEIENIFDLTFSINAISDATEWLCEEGFLKKQGCWSTKRNSWDSNLYLLADNFLWREYLEALVDLFPSTELINLIIQKCKPWAVALLFSINAAAWHNHQNLTRRDINKNFNILITNYQSLLPEKIVRDLHEQDWSVPPGCEQVSADCNQPRTSLTFSEFEDLFKNSKSAVLDAVNPRSDVDPAACLQKKEELMKAIPSYIHEIKSINLTNAGKIQLLALTAAGIKAADRKIQSYKNKQVSSLFRLFYSIAAAEGGEQADRQQLVTQAMLENQIAPDSALLENTTINDIAPQEFSTKGKASTGRAPQYKPASDDPYYRTPSQRDVFERQQAINREREATMAKEDPERLGQIKSRAKQLRKALGMDEEGNQVAEPNFALLSGPLKGMYQAAKKRYTQTLVDVIEEVPFVGEEGSWEEI